MRRRIVLSDIVEDSGGFVFFHVVKLLKMKETRVNTILDWGLSTQDMAAAREVLQEDER